MPGIPPLAIFGEALAQYEQIKRSFYFWYFQLQRVSEAAVSAGDFAFIDNLWADWCPGYDASEDLAKVKECIREPAHLQIALAYYWTQFDPARFRTPDWLAEQDAAWGKRVTVPTLYLHGAQDGCFGLSKEQVGRVIQHCGPGSQSELVEGAGHYPIVERPAYVNRRILDFLTA